MYASSVVLGAGAAFVTPASSFFNDCKTDSGKTEGAAPLPAMAVLGISESSRSITRPSSGAGVSWDGASS